MSYATINNNLMQLAGLADEACFSNCENQKELALKKCQNNYIWGTAAWESCRATAAAYRNECENFCNSSMNYNLPKILIDDMSKKWTRNPMPQSQEAMQNGFQAKYNYLVPPGYSVSGSRIMANRLGGFRGLRDGEGYELETDPLPPDDTNDFSTLPHSDTTTGHEGDSTDNSATPTDTGTSWWDDVLNYGAKLINGATTPAKTGTTPTVTNPTSINKPITTSSAPNYMLYGGIALGVIGIGVIAWLMLKK